MRRKGILALFVGVVTVLSFPTCQHAIAAVGLYDDFEASPNFDSGKWHDSRFVREIVSDELVSIVEGRPESDGARRNRTLFTDPQAINSIQANVKVQGASLTEIQSVAAVLEGIFYHNNSTNEDIWAGVHIGDQGAGLMAWYAVVGRNSSGVSRVISSGPVVAPGSLSLNAWYTCKIKYDGGNHKFAFTANGQAVELASGSLPANDGAPLYGSMKSVTTQILEMPFDGQGSGYISARFDNVYVNESDTAYDDFGSSNLDSTKWQSLESVRQISNAGGNNKVRLDVRSLGGFQIVGQGLRYNNTNYLEANIAVQSNTMMPPIWGANGTVQIGGWFYNDSRGPGSGLAYDGRLGDVVVVVLLSAFWDGGTSSMKLQARCYAWVALDPAGTFGNTLFYYTLPNDLAFDTEYNFSIELTDDKIIIRFNTVNVYTHNITTPVYEPSIPDRTVNAYTGHREGYLHSTYDDVRVNYATITGVLVDESNNPVVGVPVDFGNMLNGSGDQGTSDGDGTFILNAVFAGPGYWRAEPAVSTGLAAVTKALYVYPGDVIDLGTIKMPRGAKIAGYLNDYNGGSPLILPGMGLWYGGKFAINDLDSGPDGYFEFRLPLGQYQLNMDDTAEKGFTMAPVPINITDVNQTDYEGLDLTAYNATDCDSITGNIATTYTGTIYVFAFLENQEFSPENAGGIDVLWESRPDPTTGNFNILVPPGHARGGKGVRLIVMADTDAPDDTWSNTVVATQLISSTPASGVSFSYTPSGYKVEGSIRDSRTGDPLFYADILLYKVGTPDEFAGSAATDHYGHFIMYNVPAGTYKLAVISHDYPTLTKWTNSFILSDSDITIPDITLGGQPLKDELVLNFGPVYGLYHYDKRGVWNLWNGVNPSQMVTVDLNSDGTDELVAAFPGYGLYTYDSTNGWQQINTVIPEFIGAGRNNRIACDFGAVHGLWLWDLALGWRQINTVDPDKMVASDIDGDGQDEMIVSFMGYGLYYYDVPGVYTQIDTAIPENMIRFNNGIACDFGASGGLRIWTQVGGWQQWNTADPGQMMAVDIDNDGVEELLVAFPGYGLYHDDGTGAWPRINTVIPDNMIRLNNGIACDFGASHGLWIWTLAGGWQQLNTADPGQMTAVDIDKDNVGELVVSFAGYGLYYYDETSGWQLLNAVIPEDIKPINFYP